MGPTRRIPTQKRVLWLVDPCRLFVCCNIDASGKRLGATLVTPRCYPGEPHLVGQPLDAHGNAKQRMVLARHLPFACHATASHPSRYFVCRGVYPDILHVCRRKQHTNPEGGVACDHRILLPGDCNRGGPVYCVATPGKRAHNRVVLYVAGSRRGMHPTLHEYPFRGTCGNSWLNPTWYKTLPDTIS
jgi:hypothetical protein